MRSELHHSLAGIAMLAAVCVLSLALGFCAGVAVMLL
jgi:hypothetical protein